MTTKVHIAFHHIQEFMDHTGLTLYHADCSFTESSHGRLRRIEESACTKTNSNMGSVRHVKYNSTNVARFNFANYEGDLMWPDSDGGGGGGSNDVDVNSNHLPQPAQENEGWFIEELDEMTVECGVEVGTDIASDLNGNVMDQSHQPELRNQQASSYHDQIRDGEGKLCLKRLCLFKWINIGCCETEAMCPLEEDDREEAAAVVNHDHYYTAHQALAEERKENARLRLEIERLKNVVSD